MKSPQKNDNAIQSPERRRFMLTTAAGAAALMLPFRLPWAGEVTTVATLVVVRGGTPETRFETALKALGGMAQFNPSGKKVVVKPNIGWDRSPEQGANTDPELVAAVVRSFISSGAQVQVFDNTCNTAQRCYANSGIEVAAKNSGAEVSFMRKQLFDELELPDGVLLKSWPIYRDYHKADLRVNLPILKHHGLAEVTAGLKNLMGIMGGERSEIHRNFDKKLIDVVTPILPELTVIDARRMLMRNGPQGGSLEDVKTINTLIAGFDPVAVDAEGARIFGAVPSDLGYLVEAQRRGLGKIDRPDGFQEINLN